MTLTYNSTTSSCGVCYPSKTNGNGRNKNTIREHIMQKAAIALSFGMGLGLLSTSALADDVGPYGGGGGGDFRSECRPGHALIGINLRSGTALDAVVAICIPLNQEKTEWGGEAYEPTQYWGGGGGGYQKAACNPGDVVTKLRVFRGPWNDIVVVKGFTITCKDLGSDYSYVVAPTSGGTVTGKNTMKCSEIATGIHGGSGTMVDSLGLVCAD